MKKIQSKALMMAIALIGTVGITACSSSEEIDENVVYDSSGNAGVKSEFVISIPRSVVRTTRMSDDITQSASSAIQFRGIDHIRLIAFEEAPTTTSEKNSDILELSAIDALSSPGQLNYKVYTNQFVPVGTSHFLFYGKAKDGMSSAPTMTQKFQNGILHPTGLENDDFTNPGNLSFALEQIYSSSDPDATGEEIVTFLTELANISTTEASAPHNKWSTTTNLSLATLYKNFIGLTTASSNSLATILGRLYSATGADRILSGDPAYKLAQAIRTKIGSACSSFSEGSPATLKSEYAGYPTNLGLPEGAARVEWNESAAKFVDIAAKYSETFQQSLTDYVYPAALWYYVSTPLKAAGAMKSDKYESQSNWNDVISNVYQDADNAVQAGTQSIALKDPVQYGVGRVETKIKMGSGDFYDRNGKKVTIGSGYTLTGFLLGGQNTVGYKFTPSLNENKPIYDRDVPSGLTAKVDYTTNANQTLALETYSNQVVNAALELVNNGSDFMGADGIIPAGGTFYLAVRLDPVTGKYEGDGTKPDQIVLQDHVTRIIVTIKNGQPHVEYVKDEDGVPIGVDTDGDGVPDNLPDTPIYDVNGDGNPDTFIDPDNGGPGWDTDGDGVVDITVDPDPDTGEYPDSPDNPEGLGTATNGIPDLSSPSIELGTSVDLVWKEGLILEPKI